MPTDTNDADFKAAKHRLLLEFDRAIVELENTIDQRDAPTKPARILDFVPMAAAGEDAKLPGRVPSKDDRAISITLKEDGDSVVVTIAAEGMRKIKEFANRAAVFKTLDNAVFYEFRFDALGTAQFSLANTKDVHTAIMQKSTVILEPSAP